MKSGDLDCGVEMKDVRIARTTLLCGNLANINEIEKKKLNNGVLHLISVESDVSLR